MNYTVVEIDMLNDFSDQPKAALPVPGMLNLVGKIATLEKNAIRIITFCDSHGDDAESQKEFEIFGPHCIEGTWGWQRVPGLLTPHFLALKRTTDSWHNLTDTVIDIIQAYFDISDKIAVTGVVTGICVKAFVDGAIERGLAKKIVVISDCIANLNIEGVPSDTECFELWKSKGVEIMTFEQFMASFC